MCAPSLDKAGMENDGRLHTPLMGIKPVACLGEDEPQSLPIWESLLWTLTFRAFKGQH